MITPQRDLRSAGSLWLNDRQTALRHRSRPARQVYDIAIVGAGVSGALAASAIADLGKSVVILDRRGPATGSTAASTAMIQWEIDKTLGELAQTFGEDRAAAIYRSSLAGLVSLRRQVIAQRIDCDWVDRTALTVSGDAIGQRGLKAELGLRRARPPLLLAERSRPSHGLWHRQDGSVGQRHERRTSPGQADARLAQTCH